MNFKFLKSQIQTIDGSLKQEANKAVNRLLTIRNWLIGYYIVEYEQNGEDRSKYGTKLLAMLADSISIKGLSETNLKLNRLFYLAYPSLSNIIRNELNKNNIEIRQTLSDELNKNNIEIRQTLSDELNKSSINTVTQGSEYDIILADSIINKLSFSHILLLITVENPHKRAFYATEAIKGTWSVREMKRQMNTLLYERSGMSAKPALLVQNTNKKVAKHNPHTFIKDIYTFEFLGLPQKDAVEESDLHTALLDHLQNFLLEMGHGFCLETRQKRILIGDEYFFIDLVFYHRILKCHILIELKVNEFAHDNAGQLNTYINYYKKEYKKHKDNPPVGILLVTNKNNALVEFATAGMDEKLFVRQYLVELPAKKELEAFLKKELKKL